VNEPGDDAKRAPRSYFVDVIESIFIDPDEELVSIFVRVPASQSDLLVMVAFVLVALAFCLFNEPIIFSMKTIKTRKITVTVIIVKRFCFIM
jgi:hypothetical protein